MGRVWVTLLLGLVCACGFESGGLGSAGADSLGGSSGGMSTDGESSMSGGSSGSAGSEGSTTGLTGADPSAGSDSDPETSGGAPSDGEPFIELSDTPSYDFGMVEVGANAEHTFVLTNVGDAEATELTIGELAGAFSLGASTCGQTLAAGQSCEVEALLSPIDLGVVTDTFALKYGPAPHTTIVEISGVGGGTTTELVVNGGAEDGGAPPPGWTIVAGDDWAADDFTFSGISAHTGSNSFHPGQDNPSTHELIQDISVEKYAASVDAGALRFDFEGWGRSWYSGQDDYRIVVEFRDDDEQLGDELLDTDWEIGTAWTRYAGSAVAPAGTRTVRIRLRCDLDNSICDAFFDDISLTATYEP